MNRYAVIVMALVLAGAWMVLRPSYESARDAQHAVPLPIAALFSCTSGKTVSAAFYQGSVAQTPVPGEPPRPTGWVEVSFDHGATTTLAQTLSADGARYANADESVVFWNKGDEAIVMHGEKLDPAYVGCKTR